MGVIAGLYLLWSLRGILEVFEYHKSYFLPYYIHYIALYIVFIFLSAISFRRKISIGVLFSSLFIVPFFIFSYAYPVINLRYLYPFVGVFFILASGGLVELVKMHRKAKYVVYPLLILLLLLSGFLFVPAKSYHLEPDTPQPPFNEAYAYLSTIISPNDTLIVTQPAIAELYLRKPDYWHPFSYDNYNYFDNYMTNNIERYTGIAISENTNHTGYLVIDDMAKSRSNISISEPIKTWGNSFWNRVYVYRLE